MEPPEIRYAKSGDVHIAYQVVGSGPLDLVWVPGFVSNLELEGEYTETQHFVRRLTSFCRVIRFDKRGTGLSDRDAGIPSLEQRMDDVRAVMDAVGSQRAALFGVSEGGSMSMLFAATYPARTRALVFYGSYARYPRSRAESAEFIEVIDRGWGTGATLRFFARIASSNEKRCVPSLDANGWAPRRPRRLRCNA